MRNNADSSFRFLKPERIEEASQIDKLDSPYGVNPTRSGCEAWAVAWAPDSSYFAWSCGLRVVQLIPWNRVKNKIDDDSAEEENNQHIDNGLQHSFDEPMSTDQDQHFRNGYQQNMQIGCHRIRQRRKKHIIDCGELVWSLAFGTGKSHRRFSVHFHMFHFYDDLILATGLQSGRIKLWDCNTGSTLMELLDHREVVRDLHFAPDGSLMLVSASRDGTLKLWDLNDDGNMTKTLRGSAKWVYGCRWSPDCKYIACVGTFRSVVIWNMDENPSIYKRLNGHYHDVVACDFSPDGAVLATASYDTRVIIWDHQTGDYLRELGHLFPPPRPIFAGGANDYYVRSVSFSSDGSYLSTVGDDGYVRFWNSRYDDDPEVIASFPNSLCCAYARSSATVAVGTRNGAVAFYKAPHPVPRLQHLCRVSLRRRLPSAKIDFLILPLRIKEYLKYREL